MAKQVLLDDSKVVRIECMSIAGGSLELPKGHKYYANLELDYTGIELNEAIQLASEGSSIRVKAQAKLRALGAKALENDGAVLAESAGEVNADDLGTFQFDVSTDFESERGGPRDPKKQATSAFKKMDDEQRIAFIMETLGVDEDAARGMLG